MIVPAAALLFLCGGLAQADDNTLRINADEVRLRARPSEKAPTLLKLSDGQMVKLIERKGRWLKVQVRGKQGWIPRTYVEEDLRGDEEVVAARESAVDSRDRRTKTNLRRKDKGFDTLDDDARGEDGITESVDDEGQATDDEQPEVLGGKKKGSKKQQQLAKRKVADEEEEEVADDEEEAPRRMKKGKKGAKAGLREGATVTMKGKTPVRMKPSKKAGSLFETSKGEQVEVILINEDDPEYVRIQTEDGSKGWVPRKALAVARPARDEEAEEEDEGEEVAAAGDDGGDAAESEEGAPEEEASEDEDAEASVDKKGSSFFSDLHFGLHGSLGVVAKSQTFTSTGTDPVKSNYDLGNNAPAVILGFGVGKAFGRYDAGLEATYVRTVGGKGITVKNGTDMETVSWVTQQIDLRFALGYWLTPKKYLLGASLGYHIGQVAVAPNEIALLPGERLAGVKVGAMFAAPLVSEKIGVRADANMLMSGSLTQQAGVRDGESSTTKAYYFALAATYRFRPKIEFEGGYGMAYEKFKFDGASERNTGVSGGRRKDMQHTLGVGVAYLF